MLAAPAFEGFPLSVADAPLAPIPTLGLALWLDGTRGIALDGASSRVASWTPRGGTGGAAQQATTALMPTATTLNGLPAVLFDGADDAMALASGAALGDTLSLFVVAQVADLSTLRTFFGSVASGGPHWYVQTGGSQRLNSQGAATLGIGTSGKVTAGNRFLASATFDRNGGTSGPWAFRFNRAADASGTASFGGFAQPIGSLGAQGLSASYFAGAIGEIVAYSRVLSAAEIGKVEGYLAAKWGTP